MPPIIPHESDAEFITPEDVENDVAFLTEALLEKQIQRVVRELLRQSDIYVTLQKLVVTLQKLVASGRFANEVAVLSHAVRTLHFAIEAKQDA